MMDAMESEAVEHSISTQASRVEEQQLDVDDGRLAELEQIARSADPKSVVPSTELLIEPVSLPLPLPLPGRLQARLVSMATNLLRRVRLLGNFLLWMMRSLWGKMKRAWGGGDDTDADTDADLVNFLTNMYLTDFFSLEKSRKVLCLLAGPSLDKESKETADRLFKKTSENKHFKRSVLVKLPDDGPADSATILAEILVQIRKTEDHSAGKDRIEIIKEALEHVRYLVLIPNLRGAETWKEIGGAFPENEKSSRVIITTSRLEVAEECTSAESDLIYKVGAGAAADGNMLSEEDEDALLSECTDCLRNCSLYLSTVKDGDVLFEEAMVRKWVAEELIKEEKMGHEHFHDLLSRGVIQKEPGPQRFRAEPAYVVNRRMLPHLRHKSEHGKFAAHVDAGSAEGASAHPMVATGEIPRLSLRCDPSSTTTTSQPAVLLPDDHRPKPAETFFNNMVMMFTRRKTAAEEQQRRRILGHARSLTVRGHCKGLLSELDGDKLLLLDLQGCQDLNNDDVLYICDHLKGLKYLSFNGTPVSEIPRNIENLKRLETLDLRETKVTVLPSEIYELPELSHMFVSNWLKMAEGYSAEDVRSNVKDHRLLLNIAVLDIRICQLAIADLEKLGNMENLRSLALTLLGLQTEEMVITKDLPFKKLRVFSLDCRVAWITFREGSMPELRRLYLWLYAGPPGKTPSGTNHLKKLHQVTLRYSGNYEESACVKETTRIMEEEDTKRARATTFVTNGENKVPRIQVPTHSKKTLVLLVLKLLRSFYDCIPYTKRLRPKLAEWIERRPALAIPLLYLAFFILVAILVTMAPLLIKVAIWLARRALHAAALIFLHQRYGNRTFIVSVPILAYHLFRIVILAYYVLSPAVQLVCATILGLLRLILVYILTPLGYTLAALFSLLAPLVFVYYLPSLPRYCLHTLLRRFFPATLPPRFPNLLPPLPKLVLRLSAATGTIVFFIRILLLWLYFSPRLLCSTVTAILQLVRTIAEWLILGA